MAVYYVNNASDDGNNITTCNVKCIQNLQTEEPSGTRWQIGRGHTSLWLHWLGPAKIPPDNFELKAGNTQTNLLDNHKHAQTFGVHQACGYNGVSCSTVMRGYGGSRRICLCHKTSIW